MRMGPLIALACAAPLLVSACGGSSAPADTGGSAADATTAASSRSTTTGGAPTTADALRARLTRLALEQGDAAAAGWGVTDAWLAAVPDLATEAGGFTPPPGGVSATPTGVYLKGEVQEDVLPFAVRGTDGACAGAILIVRDGSLVARDIEIPAGGDCTAIAVATVAEDGPPLP